MLALAVLQKQPARRRTAELRVRLAPLAPLAPLVRPARVGSSRV
jgi:hypothetical protein